MSRKTDFGFPKAPGPDCAATSPWAIQTHVRSGDNILNQTCRPVFYHETPQVRGAITGQSRRIGSGRTAPALKPRSHQALVRCQAWLAGSLSGWMDGQLFRPSTRTYWWRRWQPDWNFLRNRPGSGSCRVVHPRPLRASNCRTSFRVGCITHLLGSPSFSPVRITCHYAGRAKYDQLQDKLYQTREPACSRHTLGRV